MFYKVFYIQRIYNAYTYYINLKFHVIYILIKGAKIQLEKLIKTHEKSLLSINIKPTKISYDLYINLIYKSYT